MSSVPGQQLPSIAQPADARNLIIASVDLSAHTVDRHVARGRRLRSEALHRFARGAGRGAIALATRLNSWYRRWRDVRCAERELRKLSPQTLRDIGIEGHQIPAIARGISDARGNEARDAVQMLLVETTKVENWRWDEAA